MAGRTVKQLRDPEVSPLLHDVAKGLETSAQGGDAGRFLDSSVEALTRILFDLEKLNAVVGGDT